jgi:hypothetical protein
MEHQALETKSDDVKEVDATYSIHSYAGASLPDSYRNLVFSKWLRSLRYGNEYFRLVDSDAYFSTYQRFITALLSKPETVVKLAVLTESPDVVLGFSVIRNDTLDYIHVHKDMRKQGIGTSLFPKNITTITHITNIGMSIWSSKLSNVKFNPFKE